MPIQNAVDDGLRAARVQFGKSRRYQRRPQNRHHVHQKRDGHVKYQTCDYIGIIISERRSIRVFLTNAWGVKVSVHAYNILLCMTEIFYDQRLFTTDTTLGTIMCVGADPVSRLPDRNL